MDKLTALNNFEQSRLDLSNTIKSLPPEKIVSIQVEGNWTIKDILGHITAWELALLKPMQSLAVEGVFSVELVTDGEGYNQDHANHRKDWSLEKIQLEMDEVRNKILDAAAKIPDEEWSKSFPAPWGGEGTLANHIHGLAWHENEHAEVIQKWIETHP